MQSNMLRTISKRGEINKKTIGFVITFFNTLITLLNLKLRLIRVRPIINENCQQSNQHNKTILFKKKVLISYLIVILIVIKQ